MSSESQKSFLGQITEGNIKGISKLNCFRQKNMICLENKFLTRSGYKKIGDDYSNFPIIASGGNLYAGIPSNSLPFPARINMIYDFKRVVGGKFPIIPSSLLWWCKCEDNASITTPEIGAAPNTILKTYSYAPAKFNNGVVGAEIGTEIRVANEGLCDIPYGCIEFWLKPFLASGDMVGSGVVGDRIESGEGAYLWGPNFRIVGATFRWGWIENQTATINSYATSWSINDLIHIAISWDSSVGLYLYVNGSLVDTISTTWDYTAVNDDMPFLLQDAESCLVDNIKIWNYKKTDFSDRNTEGY